jgi:hypothetical protein
MSPTHEDAKAREALEYRNSDTVQTLMLYRVSRSTGWIAFFSLVIAIVAGASGYFLWNQLGVMQEQLDQFQELSERVQKSFESARIQSVAFTEALQAVSEQMGRSNDAMDRIARAADAPLSLDRPWVGIESISVGQLRPGEALSMIANVHNSGRTPAINVKVYLNSLLVAGKNANNFDAEECKTCPQSVLLPNAALNIDVSLDSSIITASTVNRVKSGDETIWLTGRIDYIDSLARPHITRVCMNYVPKTLAFGTCQQGNSLD